MLKILKVYLYRNFVGRLIQDEHGDMDFEYEPDWLKNPSAVPLSHSLPLRAERFSRKECQGFFAGILPEEGKREIIAKNLGISARNDHAMLEKIGGECAGAVTFITVEQDLPTEQDYGYRFLNDAELADILRKLPRWPLMAGGKDIRLSLAGAQDKIAVYIKDGKVAIPLGGAPSTHILKPAIKQFEGVVFNEALCMELARKTGGPVANVKICRVSEIDYLQVERYDRRTISVLGLPEIRPHLRRSHQEDFCQALGIIPEKKYQNEGGPSLKQCFSLLRDVSAMPVIDLQHLLSAVIFNVLIGNNDAHGKNFSLLYHELKIDGGVVPRLSPFYDLISTTYYPELHSNMAMKIGGEYKSEKLYPKHFEVLAEEIGFAKPIVVKHVLELSKKTIDALKDIKPEHPIMDKLSSLIKDRCKLFIGRFE